MRDGEKRDSGGMAPIRVDGHADTAVGDSGELDETQAGDTGEKRAAPGAEDRLIGTVLQERYEITAKIGQGGMGAVYEARHTQIGKRVAVKILLDKYAEKDSLVARLKQEAELASSIGHPNIVDIIDFDQVGAGRTFVVMEYLEGESLGSLLAREGRLEPERAIGVARQVASALGAAHEKSIVHRDIKPENVFLQRRGDQDFVKVLDFGISKMVRAEDDPEGRLTQTGMVLGTPLYMSPEQARGDEELDHRIDVYAAGVILYEMVTGEVPFRGSNYLSIVSQVLSEEPPPPRSLNPEVSEDLELVIQRAMARDRGDRYQTMQELDDDLAALEATATGLGTTAARLSASRLRRRRLRARAAKYSLWVGMLGAVSVAVWLAVVNLTSDPPAPAPAPPVAAAAPEPDPTAAVLAPDAAPATPEYETVSIRIESIPEGARVYEGGRLLGTAPFEHPWEKIRQEIELVAELDGYEPATFRIRPHIDHAEPYRVPLKKARRGASTAGRRPSAAGQRTPEPKTPDRGKGRVDDTADGDLGGFRHPR